MLRAAFYSDQVIPENAKVDARLVEIIKDHGNRIGYVPSGPEPDLRYFNAKTQYYGQYGLDLSVFYDVGGEATKANLDALLSCDAIHLSGGDTTAFLARLRRSGMLGTLSEWAKAGGILIGTSAGAILMTPTIAVGALLNDMLPEDGEEKRALNLVPFEFFPHFKETDHLQDLLAYSSRSPWPLVACPDGDGLIVLGDSLECLGNPIWLFRGKLSSPAPTRLSQLAPASQRSSPNPTD